jgi:hypothetical protein
LSRIDLMSCMVGPERKSVESLAPTEAGIQYPEWAGLGTAKAPLTAFIFGCLFVAPSDGKWLDAALTTQAWA